MPHDNWAVDRYNRGTQARHFDCGTPLLNRLRRAEHNQKAIALIDRWAAEDAPYVSGNPPQDCRDHCLALCAMKTERDEALATCTELVELRELEAFYRWHEVDRITAERDRAISGCDGTRYALSNVLTVNAGLMRERDEREHWAGLMYRRALRAELEARDRLQFAEKADRERLRLMNLLRKWGDVCMCGYVAEAHMGNLSWTCPKCGLELQ